VARGPSLGPASDAGRVNLLPEGPLIPEGPPERSAAELESRANGPACRAHR